MKRYTMRDMSGDTIIEADNLASARSKAIDLLTDAWQDTADADLATIHGWFMIDGTRHVVRVDPTEPRCTTNAHEWVQDGVVGHGGGVIYTETCTNCGLTRRTDTWADFEGEQGYVEIQYERPESLEPYGGGEEAPND